jgi:CheY-like chemotaxis protein
MGGQLEVYSSHGHGSVFTMTIPQVVVSHEPIAAVQTAEEIRLLIFEERLPVARSISVNLSALGVKHELVSTMERFNSKLSVESWSHLILPAADYPDFAELIAEQSPEARVGLTIRESQPMGLKNVSFLPTPVHSQSLANFLNDSSISAIDRRLSGPPGPMVKMPRARVLVVDDLETNLIVAEGLMEDYGMTIDLCRSGLEAVDMVQANDYDLVFMDHMMPGLDGIETTRLIRTLEDRRFAALPIVALTANAIHGMREIFLDHGMNDFLPKPIDSVRLEEILLAWIPKDKQVKVLTEGETTILAEPETAPKEAEGGPQGPPDQPDRIRLGEFDSDAGLTLNGGKMQNYQRVLSVFLGDAQKAKGIMEQAIDRGDLKEYSIHIHALKGATATIGARNLSELAKELEAASRQNDVSLLKARTPVFLESLNKILSKVNDYLSQNVGDPKSGRELNRQDLVAELQKLSKAFEEIDTKTIGLTLTNLKSSPLPAEMESELSKITDCFFEVEYDQAVSLIEGLLADLSSNPVMETDQGKKMLN